MPRLSPFPIILTTEEECCLRAMARKYTSPYNEVVRARAILLAAEGRANKDIGVHLNLPRQIVSKCRKRFFYERLHELNGYALAVAAVGLVQGYGHLIQGPKISLGRGQIDI